MFIFYLGGKTRDSYKHELYIRIQRERKGERRREREVTDPNVFSLHVIPNLNHPHTQTVCASHTQVYQSSGVLLFCVVVL